MSQMECIGGLKAVMAREGGGGVGVASEALMKITAVHNEDIVEQVRDYINPFIYLILVFFF